MKKSVVYSDYLHLLKIGRFPASNEWGIPDLLPAVGPPVDAKWYGYRDVCTPDDSACLHCFTDDYRFESAWTYYVKSYKHVKKFKFAVAPDFSQFAGWPVAARMWQCYRSAWVARLWQAWGLDVMPAPNWTGERKHEPWQWAGMPHGGPVAVQVPEMRNKDTARRFERGYLLMLENLQPSRVYVMGRFPKHLEREIEIVRIASWAERLPCHKYAGGGDNADNMDNGGGDNMGNTTPATGK